MPEEQDIATQKNERESLFNELRQMFRFALQKDVHKPWPYMGEDRSMYLTEIDGYPAFPIAEYSGKVTVDRLKDVYLEVSEASDIEATEKRKLYRRILSAFLNIGGEDGIFENQLLASSAAPTEKEAVADNKEQLADDTIIYEFAFTGDAKPVSQDADLIYRNILRTGTWKISPNNKEEPLVITKDMLENISSSFADAAFEYVTVPETHEDLPSQNRGFIENVQVQEDEERPGEYVLRGGFKFTNKDTKNAVLDGSIVGVSCGIVFNHARKIDGKIFPHALHHVALTNKPWITGLGEWDKIAASEYNAQIVVGIEEKTVENLSQTKEQDMADDKVQLSQEQIDALVAENTRLKLAQQRVEVDKLVSKYQTDKHILPAVLTQAEKILLAAQATPKMMTLSETNTPEEFDLAQTVLAMLDAMPTGVDLTQAKTEDGEKVNPDKTDVRQTNDKKPEEKAAELRQLLGLQEVTAEDMKNLGG